MWNDASWTRILHAAEGKHVRAVNVTKVDTWVIARALRADYVTARFKTIQRADFDYFLPMVIIEAEGLGYLRRCAKRPGRIIYASRYS